jgi:hypothetical protein
MGVFGQDEHVSNRCRRVDGGFRLVRVIRVLQTE